MTALDTLLVQAGEPRILGAIAMPVFQSAMYEDPPGGGTDYHALRYIRLNNVPNHRAVCDKLAAVEGAEAGVVTASGMAAIATALLTVVGAGDHILVQRCTYGGTNSLVTQDLARLGVRCDFIDDDPVAWRKLCTPRTRAVLTEAITNPLLDVPDHEALLAFAQSAGLLTMIDNTMASPVNFRPLALGYDLCLYSATKYLNGHSDIVAGVILGSTEHIAQVKRRLDHFGGSMDPHAAFLLQRGVKTLGLRMRQHNRSTLAIARWLEAQPIVKRVRYPFLESHPHYDRARRLFAGGGGVLSFELDGTVGAAIRFVDSLKLAVKAPSFGGVETLVTRPAATSHAGLTAEDRHAIGITDGLVRLAIGIEDTDDLLADVAQALGQARSAG